MTEERRWGKHIKNESMLDRNTYQEGFERELVRFLDKHCTDDPDIFITDRKSRDKLLSKFERDVSVLKHYPKVLRAMFTKLNEPIPANMRPD